MNDKVLVTGANGQLGTELRKLLPNSVFTSSTDLDVTNSHRINFFIEKHSIETIINCAAYTLVDQAEDHSELAYKINAVGPKNLAQTGCKIIHISTDYVFDGKNHKPYRPLDRPNPISIYGQTKLEGEYNVLKYSGNAIIIRTAWLYSSYGKNFVKTIRRLGNENQTLNVIADQIGTPTYAGDLAKAIVSILPQINKKNKGIYHYTNEGVCSWYDFAKEIIEVLNLSCKVYPIPSSAYLTKAIRPFYSVLDKTSIKTTFGITIPYWRESLKTCLKQF